MPEQLRTYYVLTKPGIIYGNCLTAIGGFLLAARGHIDGLLAISLVTGTSLVIASACVINNYVDRDIDQKMTRTRRRALATGTVATGPALLYAALLGIIGLMILITGTNRLVVLIGIIGFVAYTVLYGYAKRHSVHGTLVGTISGATPIVAGYCAVTSRFDGVALVLFGILVTWQMPHFYAIALRRQQDYAAAGLPVLPVARGVLATKRQIVAYSCGFVIAIAALTVFGYAGYSYLVVMLSLGLYWLWHNARGFSAADDIIWAKRSFMLSLLMLPALTAMLALDGWLP